MTENSYPKKQPADSERGNSLCAWLIEALALGMGALAVFQYQPEGFVAALIVFVGAYTLTHSLQGLNWLLLAGVCELLLVWLATAIHLGTLMMVAVGTSATGLVFTFLLPGIRSGLLALGIVAGDGCSVSPAGRAVCGVAGAAWDQDFGADRIHQPACAAFAETPDETTPKTEEALISNADR
jgi:hypothetical protein